MKDNKDDRDDKDKEQKISDPQSIDAAPRLRHSGSPLGLFPPSNCGGPIDSP